MRNLAAIKSGDTEMSKCLAESRNPVTPARNSKQFFVKCYWQAKSTCYKKKRRKFLAKSGKILLQKFKKKFTQFFAGLCE